MRCLHDPLQVVLGELGKVLELLKLAYVFCLLLGNGRRLLTGDLTFTHSGLSPVSRCGLSSGA